MQKIDISQVLRSKQGEFYRATCSAFTTTQAESFDMQSCLNYLFSSVKIHIVSFMISFFQSINKRIAMRLTRRLSHQSIITEHFMHILTSLFNLRRDTAIVI